MQFVNVLIAVLANLNIKVVTGRNSTEKFLLESELKWFVLQAEPSFPLPLLWFSLAGGVGKPILKSTKDQVV